MGNDNLDQHLRATRASIPSFAIGSVPEEEASALPALPVIEIPIQKGLCRISILTFSDCRRQDLDGFVDWLRGRDRRPDLILYAGDDCRRFRPDVQPDPHGSLSVSDFPEAAGDMQSQHLGPRHGANYFELIASESRFGLGAVIGNDDLPASRQLLQGKGVFELHGSALRIGSFLIFGLDGAPMPSSPEDGPPIGLTLHPEDEIAAHLRRGLGHDPRGHVLLLSHAPPHGILDHAIRFGRRHIGSRAIRDCLARHNAPELVICGHVHSQGGRSEVVGRTLVINVASHDGRDDPLRVMELEWDTGLPPASDVMSIQWHALYPAGELQSIHGIGCEYARRLQAAGIRSVELLAGADPATIGAALGWSERAAMPLIARARARREGRPILLQPYSGPAAPRVFFDIETDPYGGYRYVWLIGCYDEATGEFRQFVARSRADERRALADFAAHCNSLVGRTWLSYSGCNFDRGRLAARMQALGMPVPALIGASVDLLPIIRRSVALPTTGYGLKIAAVSLGFDFRHAELSGWDVALEYDGATRGGATRGGGRISDEILRDLLGYNEDDVRALVHVVHEVEELSIR